MAEKKVNEETIHSDDDANEINTQNAQEQNKSEETQELSEVEQLTLELAKKEIELQTKNDQLLRKVAEFDNMRKRVERERFMTIQLSKAEALNDFLPILDDLLRTLDSSKELDIDDSFLKGVEMVAEKFENVLIRNGIQKINETGVPFNVDFHEALMRQTAPSPEIESNTVLQVFEPGYKMGDRVIRHAKVIVSE